MAHRRWIIHGQQVRTVARTLVAVASLLLVTCTQSARDPQSPRIDTPSATSPSASATSPSPSPAVIELPPLTPTGIAAMWSRSNSSGVSLLTTKGRLLAKVQDAIIYSPLTPPGTVILKIEDEHWVLDSPAHELRQITAGRARRLVRASGVFPLPRDAFTWSVLAPTSPQVLGQFWQGVSECQKPIAMWRRGTSLEASPVTGDLLTTAQPTYALGWTEASEALVAVADGPCDAGSARYRRGVYAFDQAGGARQISVPPGSYAFQMWSAR
jgi:hypothetical protein